MEIAIFFMCLGWILIFIAFIHLKWRLTDLETRQEDNYNNLMDAHKDHRSHVIDTFARAIDKLNSENYSNYCKIADLHKLFNLEYLPKQPEKLVFKSSKSKKTKG